MNRPGTLKLAVSSGIVRVQMAGRSLVLVAALALGGVLLVTLAGPNTSSIKAHAQAATPSGANPANPCSAPSIFKFRSEERRVGKECRP